MNSDLVELVRNKIGEDKARNITNLINNTTFIDRSVSENWGVISLRETYLGNDYVFRINYDLVQRDVLEDKHYLVIDKFKSLVGESKDIVRNSKSLDEDYQTSP